MTSSGFIRRGPMAADVFEQHFTRIHNAVFRDRRMSYKAKGIFGLISTHRDGFGLSIESLVSFGTDGVSAVRTGLNELERFGYLKRDQKRLDGPTKDNPHARRGSWGSVEYFITDMPDGLLISVPAPQGGETENPSSDPSCEKRTSENTPRSGPSCDVPRTDEPPAEDQRRKKIIPQKNNSLSHPQPSPEPHASSATESDEREQAARPDSERAPQETPAPESGTHGLPEVQRVLDAYAAALGEVQPLKSVLKRLRTEAQELLDLRWPVEHVAALAGQLPRLGFSSLTRHAEYNPPPVPKPGRAAAGPGMCEQHPTFVEGDCSPCRIAERERSQHQSPEPAGVDGAALLARLMARQSAS